MCYDQNFMFVWCQIFDHNGDDGSFISVCCCLMLLRHMPLRHMILRHVRLHQMFLLVLLLMRMLMLMLMLLLMITFCELLLRTRFN